MGYRERRYEDRGYLIVLAIFNKTNKKLSTCTVCQ